MYSLFVWVLYAMPFSTASGFFVVCFCAICSRSM